MSAAVREWQAAGLISPSQAAAMERLSGGGVAAIADLEHWAELGILTPSQLASIRRLERPPAAAPAAAVAQPPPEPVAAPSVLRPRAAGASTGTAAAPGIGTGSWIRPDLRQMGIILTVLALLGVAANLLGVMTDVFIAPWRLAGADLEDLLHVGGAVLGIAGGLAMYRGLVRGRWIAIAGLAINILVTLAYAGGRLGDPLVYLAIVVWGFLIATTLRTRRAGA